MRLLHTSDWHLGRSFHREDMLGAQAAFADFLVAAVRSEGVDAVLVSGDVYDRALPAVDAVALCSETLRRLGETGARTVVISGNHDSARRLGFGADLIDAAGVHLRTSPAGCGRPVLLPADAHGEVAVYGLPYLEPDAVAAELGVTERGHAAVLGAGMARVRADLARRPAGTRSVVLAHAFVTGAVGCDSERDISVGGACAVPVSTFSGVDYVALGHLHGAQRLAPAVGYSGSPLAYSFSEDRHVKSVDLVELGPPGQVTVTRLPCPAPRPLARLRGRLEDLLADARWAGYAGHYLQVALTDPDRPRDPMARLRARFPHTLVLSFDPEGPPRPETASYAARLQGRDDLGVTTGFVEHVRRAPATTAEVALLREALLAGRRAEERA